MATPISLLVRRTFLGTIAGGLVAALFRGSSLAAQEAGLSSPVARTSEAKHKLRSFLGVTGGGANSVQCDISVQDSSNVEIRTYTAVVPDPAHPTATFSGMCTAMMTVRATETGTDPRKLAFRVLGYLSDNGYFPPSTLTP
jgi:glutamine synthetase